MITKYSKIIYKFFINPIIFIFIVIYGFLPLIGINFLWHDETAHFNLFASKDLYTIVTNYTLPNNHIFFTILQSLIPNPIVYNYPLTLRIIPFLILIATIIYLNYELKKKIAINSVILLNVILLIFFICVDFFQISYFARGYLLGSLLLIIGILNFKNIYVSSLAFSLSSYTIPTNFLFIFIYLILNSIHSKFNLKNIGILFLTTFLTILLYFPIIDQLKYVKNTIYHNPKFILLMIANSLSIYAILLSIIIILVYSFSKNKTLKLSILSSIIAIISFEILYQLNIIAAPFFRNFYFLLFTFYLFGILVILKTLKKKIAQYSFLLIINTMFTTQIISKKDILFQKNNEYDLYIMSRNIKPKHIKTGWYYEPSIYLFFKNYPYMPYLDDPYYYLINSN